MELLGPGREKKLFHPAISPRTLFANGGGPFAPGSRFPRDAGEEADAADR